MDLRYGMILAGICACLCFQACVSGAKGREAPSVQSDTGDEAVMAGKDPVSALEGWIREKVAFPRTLSEYTYFVIVSDRDEETTLFNEKGFSGGFGEWEGKKVVVRGKRATGRVGFKKTISEGFAVESIEEKP